MDHILVLSSGIGFIILVGIVMLLLRINDASSLSNRAKRTVHLLAILLLAIVCIVIFDWYSDEYIKNGVLR